MESDTMVINGNDWFKIILTSFWPIYIIVICFGTKNVLAAFGVKNVKDNR